MTEVMPSEAVPKEVMPTEAIPTKVMPTEVESTEAEPTEARPIEAEVPTCRASDAVIIQWHPKNKHAKDGELILRWLDLHINHFHIFIVVILKI